MCDQMVSRALCPLCKKKGWSFFGPKTNDPQKLKTKVDKRTSQALKGVGDVQNGCSYYFLEDKCWQTWRKSNSNDDVS